MCLTWQPNQSVKTNIFNMLLAVTHLHGYTLYTLNYIHIPFCIYIHICMRHVNILPMNNKCLKWNGFSNHVILVQVYMYMYVYIWIENCDRKRASSLSRGWADNKSCYKVKFEVKSLWKYVETHVHKVGLLKLFVKLEEFSVR